MGDQHAVRQVPRHRIGETIGRRRPAGGGRCASAMVPGQPFVRSKYAVGVGHDGWADAVLGAGATGVVAREEEEEEE